MQDLIDRTRATLDLDPRLHEDLAAAHAGLGGGMGRAAATQTRVFNIACQFDAPEVLGGGSGGAEASSVQRGVPCRFRSAVELGPVDALASAPVAAWRRAHTAETWSAEEDLAILRAASALHAWESYRGARSAFPGSQADADHAFPKPCETEAERELFAERFRALNDADNLDRRRLLLSLIQNRAAFGDDDAQRRDDELFERIHAAPGGALTGSADMRGCELTKAVRRRLEALRPNSSSSSAGADAAGKGGGAAAQHAHGRHSVLLDLAGMHGRAAPNTSVFGAMTPDMTIVTKSADMQTKEQRTGAVRCASSSVLSASNLLRQTLQIHALSQPGKIESRNDDALLGQAAAAAPASTTTSGDGGAGASGASDEESSGGAGAARAGGGGKQLPPVVLSEYDDQFGLTPGRDSFGVFSAESLQRFFNLCEDTNAVELFAEAEAEYAAVREAVERYAVHTSERRVLEQRRAALAGLEQRQRAAEAELRASFQRTFDGVVASIASAFEAHLVGALGALRGKMAAERERVRRHFDTEEHALLMARYKQGLAAWCPDAVANRRSFHGLEARRGAILGDAREWHSGKPDEDPREVLTRLLLLTETLQAPQLSHTLCGEMCAPNASAMMTSTNAELDVAALFRGDSAGASAAQQQRHRQQQHHHHHSHHVPQFAAFYNRRELHEFPLLSRETMRALLTAAPLAQLVEAKEAERAARRAEQARAEAAAHADYEQRLQAAKAARSTVAVELHPPPPPPPPSMLSKLADEELELRRRVRTEQLESLSASELQLLLQKCKVTAARLKRKFRVLRRHGTAAAMQHPGVAATASSSDSDDYNFFSEQEARTLPLWKRHGRRLGALRAEQVDYLCNDLTTDSDEDAFLSASGVDVLVARLLAASGAAGGGGGGAARDNESAKLRVAITQHVNKFRARRRRHVEDAVYYLELIDDVLKRRLQSQKGPLLNIDAVDGASPSQAAAPDQQQQQMPQLKSSSLLLLTSSFRRGNRWRIHNSVSAHETALAVSERGTHTVLTALRPLTPYTYFAMFPNEATLRRRCGTSSAKVFFQVRVLCGPTPSATNTRLIGVGFDASAHSRKVPMLGHDPLDPGAGKRQRALEQRKRDAAAAQQGDGNGGDGRSSRSAGGQRANPFRWNLTSTSRDVCLAVLGDGAAPQLARDGAPAPGSPVTFGSSRAAAAAAAAGVWDAAASGAARDEAMRQLLAQQQPGFVPGTTPGPHPAEAALAADLRRTVGGTAKASGAVAKTRGPASADGSDGVGSAIGAVESDSPFYAFTDEAKLPPESADFGFLWLSNGTFLLHGTAHALGRDGTFQAGDTLHLALDEAEGTVRLFRNGQEVHSPVFCPCPPVELLVSSSSSAAAAASRSAGGKPGAKRLGAADKLFAPQLPASMEQLQQPVLERCFWGVGPIPCVTLLDTAPEHTVDGRAGKTTTYLSSDLFAIQYKTFKKADTTIAATQAPLHGGAAAPKAAAAGAGSSAAAAVLAAAAQPDQAPVTDPDVSRFALPSVECNVEGPFEEDSLPAALIAERYVPFLKAQHIP